MLHLDLVDTNQYWDEAEIIATVNGIWRWMRGPILAAVLKPTPGAMDSGSLELSYSCSSSYDCENQSLGLYDEAVSLTCRRWFGCNRSRTR